MEAVENNMEATEKTIAAALSSLESTLDSLESKMDSLESTLGSKIDSLESTLGSKIDSLGSRMDSLPATLGSKMATRSNPPLGSLKTTCDGRPGRGWHSHHSRCSRCHARGHIRRRRRQHSHHRDRGVASRDPARSLGRSPAHIDHPPRALRASGAASRGRSSAPPTTPLTTRMRSRTSSATSSTSTTPATPAPRRRHATRRRRRRRRRRGQGASEQGGLRLCARCLQSGLTRGTCLLCGFQVDEGAAPRVPMTRPTPRWAATECGARRGAATMTGAAAARSWSRAHAARSGECPYLLRQGSRVSGLRCARRGNRRAPPARSRLVAAFWRPGTPSGRRPGTPLRSGLSCFLALSWFSALARPVCLSPAPGLLSFGLLLFRLLD